MTTPRAATRQRAAARRSKWLWVTIALVVLVIGSTLGAKVWIDTYLRSERFRQFIDHKAGRSLQAQVDVAPLTFSGQSFYSPGLKARGTEKGSFATLEMDEIRADVSTRRFWEKIWDVDQVEIQRAQVRLEGPRTTEEPEAEPASERSGSGSSRWFPNRVEIGSVKIWDGSIAWKDGSLSKTAVEIKPVDGGWNIDAKGGSVVHASLPPLDLKSARLRYKEPSLFIQEAELRQGTEGSMLVSGEVKMNEQADLLAKLDRVTITPYLAGDWRARLKGKVSGEMRVATKLPPTSPAVYSGTLNLAEGQLEALPILDTIANFTRTAQFKKLNLTRATGTFRQEGDALQVTDFVAEAQGLICVEGAFTVKDGQIDGQFQLGVTPSSLQWLPGSQEKVFTVSRNGYLWAPMRLTGTGDRPKEDLSPRLASAAKDALFGVAEKAAEQTGGAAQDIIKDAGKAAKGALEMLLGH